jgi:hypothetical protein
LKIKKKSSSLKNYRKKLILLHFRIKRIEKKYKNNEKVYMLLKTFSYMIKNEILNIK